MTNADSSRADTDSTPMHLVNKYIENVVAGSYGGSLSQFCRLQYLLFRMGRTEYEPPSYGKWMRDELERERNNSLTSISGVCERNP